MSYVLCRRRLLMISMLLLLVVGGSGVRAQLDARRTSLDRQLFQACARGKLEEVKRLIALGADVDARDTRRATPVSYAVSAGHAEIVRLLAAQGAKIDLPDHTDCTPLMEAMGYRKLEVVLALLEAGADPNFASKHLETSILLAGDQSAEPEMADICAALRKAGMKEHLWEAVIKDHLSVARDLLEHEARATERTPWGTPVALMALWHRPMFDLLVAHGADLNAHDKSGMTALMWYARSADRFEADAIEPILLQPAVRMEARDLRGMTALMYAADNPRMMTLLLKRGADIRARDREGRTALMHAADQGRDPEAGIAFLLQQGAKIDARDTKGRTALWIAVHDRRSEQAISALLKAGADPNLPDNAGVTPLMWAAEQGQATVVAALRQARAKLGLVEALFLHDTAALNAALEQGADVNRRGPSGMTPLMIAVQQGDIALTERLLTLGAKSDARDSDGWTALHYAVGAQGGPWSGRRRPSGFNQHGRSEEPTVSDQPVLVRLLIAHGAPVDAPDRIGTTPLQWAAHWGFAGDVQALLERGAAPRTVQGNALANAQAFDREEVFRQLIEHGVSVDTRDDRGVPLLSLAITYGKMEEVAFLLAHRADANARDADAKTPLMYAAERGDVALVRTLLAVHADPRLKDYQDRTALDYIDPEHASDLQSLLTPPAWE